MVGRGYLVGGLATAAAVVTLVVASASSGALLGPPAAPTPRHPPPPPGPPSAGPQGNTGTDSPLLPAWLVILLSAFLLLYALGLLILVVMSQWRRRSARAPDKLVDIEPEEGPAWRAMVSTELSDAADEQLDELSQGAPRNAIVACWLRIQGAAQGAGLSPVPSETAQEFTVRALNRLSLDREAITTLSELYREARFSEHDMAEGHREQARAALAVLADQLSRQHVVTEARS